MKSSNSEVAVAILGRPRGNRGEVTATSLSSRPERFSRLRTVYLYGAGAAYEVEEVWAHGETLIFKFRGIDDISSAEKLRDQEVRIPASERIQLDPGEFFHSDLIGCDVFEAGTGRRIGAVTSFEEYGGPPLLSVDNGRVLIPFIAAICTAIDPRQNRIEVELPEGLETINAVPPAQHLS